MRTDIHRPSVITPSDYDFVAHEVMKLETFGDALVVMEQRELIRKHMEETGGTYSGHEHGGNCMVCGSVNAIYTLLFYHAATNSYVRMGADCSQKVFDSDFGFNRFRAAAHDAREALAGKKKAQAILVELGLERAWEVYSTPREEYQWEESTITDIVGKLVQYGSLSEKQTAFVGSLLQKIDNRAEIEAQRKAEAEAALPAPAGKAQVTGEVLTVKVQDGYYGATIKMLVRTVEGWKAWGTCPEGVEKGDKVTFTATFEPSPDDAKFAFFKRPRLVAA